jgi:hypothetical protein
MIYRVNDFSFSFVTGEYEIIAASLSLLRPVSMVMFAALVHIKAQVVCCYKLCFLLGLTTTWK